MSRLHGTLNVPDDVNDSDVGANTVILNDLELVLELASAALITKFDVVFEPTALKPEI
jgi:hypothetical protein